MLFNVYFNSISDLYSSVAPRVIDHYPFAVDLLQLVCVLQGASGTIEWYMDETLLPSTVVSNQLVNRTSLVYVSDLFIDSKPLLQLLGDYKCQLTTDIVQQLNGWKTESEQITFMNPLLHVHVHAKLSVEAHSNFIRTMYMYCCHQ